MLRIVLIILGLLGVISLMIGGAFGAFLWKFTPHIPEASYGEPADRTEARLQDLDYLRRMPEADKSFSDDELITFNALIDDLEARASTMTEAEFVMGVSAAGAVTENGHSGVSMSGTMNRLNSLPVRFYWFDEGLHIVRARAEHADLIGMRVVTYGGVAPEALYLQMDAFFGGNDAFLRQNSASFFAAPASLHAAGLVAVPDEVTLDLVGLDGEVSTETLPVETEPTGFFGAQRNAVSRPYRAEDDSGHDWRFLDPAMTQATWFGRYPEQALWSDTLERGGAYWRMRNVFGNEDTPLPGWLDDQAAALRDDPAEYLVLDLRANRGGDYTRAMQVARNIGELITQDGRVYVLTDGDTFSAGIVTAFYALHGAGERAVLVGAPMGDDMQFWAEGGGTPMRLPNSDIRVYVSTGYHDWENGCSDWSRCFWINTLFGVAVGQVEVDLPAALTFADYARGVDTGMEPIFAAEAERQGHQATE
ncbi:S41 family peptidase [Maricaulaceae bacterium NA33B04]|nr:S41 family peptidase [Maricaulaceae bacterium NA33B04]